MRFKQVLSIIIIIYWAIAAVLYTSLDVSKFVNLESVIYLIAITALVCLTVGASSKATLPIQFVIANYVFWKYLLGTMKLGLLSGLNGDFWMFDNYYLIAGPEEVNIWLQNGLLATLFLSIGIVIAESIMWPKLKSVAMLRDNSPLDINPRLLFIILFAIFIYSTIVFLNVGYGSISGVESDGMLTLYGIIIMEPVFIISLSILVYEWSELNDRERYLFILLIALYLLFRIVSGNRSFFLQILIFFCILFSSAKGNFKISNKFLLIISVFSIINVAFYPLALGIKNLIKTPDIVANVGLISALQEYDWGQYIVDFFSNVDGIVEIVDRLSDMGAPLRIINDKSVIDVNEHFSLLAALKRTINDMVPGDIFTDVLNTQQVWHATYFGTDAIYGGEELGLYGVYYLYFGYAISLLALFLTGIFMCYTWIILISCKIKYRFIVLAYALNSIYYFLNNLMLEVWFVNNIYRPLIFFALLSFILCIVGKQPIRFLK